MKLLFQRNRGEGGTTHILGTGTCHQEGYRLKRVWYQERYRFSQFWYNERYRCIFGKIGILSGIYSWKIDMRAGMYL